MLERLNNFPRLEVAKIYPNPFLLTLIPVFMFFTLNLNLEISNNKISERNQERQNKINT